MHDFEPKDSCCFLEQDTSATLLSTGWFQEQIEEVFVSQ